MIFGLSCSLSSSNSFTYFSYYLYVMLVLLATIQLGDRETRTFLTHTTCEQKASKKPTGNQEETNKKPANNQQETNKKPTESQKAHRETNRNARRQTDRETKREAHASPKRVLRPHLRALSACLQLTFQIKRQSRSNKRRSE